MLIPVLALLEHQMHCATTLEEIYAMVEDQPEETIQATQDYATAMTYCRDEILQQLVNIYAYIHIYAYMLIDILNTRINWIVVWYSQLNMSTH